MAGEVPERATALSGMSGRTRHRTRKRGRDRWGPVALNFLRPAGADTPISTPSTGSALGRQSPPEAPPVATALRPAGAKRVRHLSIGLFRRGAFCVSVVKIRGLLKSLLFLAEKTEGVRRVPAPPIDGSGGGGIVPTRVGETEPPNPLVAKKYFPGPDANFRVLATPRFAPDGRKWCVFTT